MQKLELPHHVLNAFMKKFLLMTVVLYPVILFSQNHRYATFQKTFENNFLRHFRAGEHLYQDGICFQYNDVIKIVINEKSNVIAMSSSENSPKWMKEEMKRLNNRMKINLLDSISKAEGIQRVVIIFPFDLRTGGICNDTLKYSNSEFDKYSKIKKEGKSIKGIVIANTIYTSSLPPIRCRGGYQSSRPLLLQN